MIKKGFLKCSSTKHRGFSITHLSGAIFLFCFSVIIEFSSASNEDKYYKTSETCQKMSTCSGNVSEFSIRRSCQCDEQCSKFGDCCQDSPSYRASELSDCVEVGNWNVLGADFIDSYYMVKTCPSTWTGEETLNKCQNYLETVKAEPILGQPITSKATNITYVNYHCARCNDDLQITTMIRWRLNVTCDENTKLPFPDIDTVLNASTIVSGGYIKPKFESDYHSCKLYVWRPVNLLRKCYKSTIDSCKSTWKNETVETLCKTYTSIVFYLGDTPYRNPYCAMCNKKKDKSLYCKKTDIYLEKDLPMLFDTSDNTGTGVGRTKICPNEDEAFDPIAKKCRHIVLSLAGQEEKYENDNCYENSSCNIYNCSKFILKPVEYLINNDFTATDLATGKQYKRGDFLLNEENGMEICAEYEMTRQKFSNVMKFVTFFGLGVSVVGLILHLLAFTINPVLRNLSGKNLASLCVALLVAYISFIVGQLVPVGGTACSAVAVMAYYGFLASFSWLLMMAYDVWHTLRLSTLHLRVVSREKRWRVFILYSIISWVLFPGFLVTVAMAVQRESQDLTFWPGFGAHNCWFGNRKALLVFFVTPIAVIMALNIILYAFSAYMICNSNVAPSSKSATDHRNYKLFARLALLMGLTWVTGFIADFIDVDAVWYIFIFLNAFQGLFIFIAFTLTKRVRTGIRSQLSGDSRSGTEETPVGCWSLSSKKLISTRTSI